MDSGRYVSYMLRLWQANAEARSPWRASLEDVHSGRRLGFAGLDDLCAFLLAIVREVEVDQPRVEEKDER